MKKRLVRRLGNFFAPFSAFSAPFSAFSAPSSAPSAPFSAPFSAFSAPFSAPFSAFSAPFSSFSAPFSARLSPPPADSSLLPQNRSIHLSEAGPVSTNPPLASRGDFGPLPPLPNRRVVVTGVGAVTPLGLTVADTWRRLVGGETAVRALRPEDLKLPLRDAAAVQQVFEQLPSRVVAGVPHGKGPEEFDVARLLPGQDARLAPFVQYALVAAREALEDASWHPADDEARNRTGVAVGGGIGCISEITDAVALVLGQKLRRLSPFFIPRILINMAAGHVSIAHRLRGPNHAAVTACASGAHSVGDAARIIRCGDADVMVAGGSESSLDALSIAGFCRAKALSTRFNDTPARASRPFDRARDGFVMGEGAGMLVLEELEHARERGSRIYAELRGYGMSGDGYHITQPAADGIGAVLAMKMALTSGGLRPEDVDYVNAHATSTPLGDALEATAIARVLGDRAWEGEVTLSSTKGAVGHLLGAAGAIEAIFTVLAIHEGMAPPTANLEDPDPVFKANFLPIATAKKVDIRAALSNSFGFGGTNACLLFAKPP